MLFIASVIFIIFSIKGNINLIKIDLYNFSFFKRFRKLIDCLFFNPYSFKGYLLGILLGFIPCGLLYGAVIASSSLKNSFVALLAMVIFGVATIPSLVLTSYGGYLIFNKLRRYLKLISKFILLINGLMLFAMSLALIFNKI